MQKKEWEYRKNVTTKFLGIIELSNVQHKSKISHFENQSNCTIEKIVDFLMKKI